MIGASLRRFERIRVESARATSARNTATQREVEIARLNRGKHAAELCAFSSHHFVDFEIAFDVAAFACFAQTEQLRRDTAEKCHQVRRWIKLSRLSWSSASGRAFAHASLFQRAFASFSAQADLLAARRVNSVEEQKLAISRRKHDIHVDSELLAKRRMLHLQTSEVCAAARVTPSRRASERTLIDSSTVTLK